MANTTAEWLELWDRRVPGTRRGTAPSPRYLRLAYVAGCHWKSTASGCPKSFAPGCSWDRRSPDAPRSLPVTSPRSATHPLRANRLRPRGATQRESPSGLAKGEPERVGWGGTEVGKREHRVRQPPSKRERRRRRRRQLWPRGGRRCGTIGQGNSAVVVGEAVPEVVVIADSFRGSRTPP